MLHKLRFLNRDKRANRNKRKWPFTPSQVIATLREAITVGSSTVALTKKEKEVLTAIAAAGDNGIEGVNLLTQVSRKGLNHGSLYSALKKLRRMELIDSRESLAKRRVGSMLEGRPAAIYFVLRKGAAFLAANNRLSTTALRPSDKSQ